MRIARWNDFINPQAFAELAVFLKGYQNQCGEVGLVSLFASEFTFHLQPSALSGDPTEEFTQEVGLATSRRCVVTLLHGVIDRLIRVPFGKLSCSGFWGTTWRDFISHVSWDPAVRADLGKKCCRLSEALLSLFIEEIWHSNKYTWQSYSGEQACSKPLDHSFFQCGVCCFCCIDL